MNVLVARPLTPLGHNWIGIEDSVHINIVALDISKSRHGRKFIYSNLIQFQKSKESIYCHYLEEEDALPSAEGVQFSPRPQSIFFHETSCRGSLTARQACAIESAARANPQRDIYVLFSAPVNELMLTSGNLEKLKSLPNIKPARVHLAKYAKKTPLEEMVQSKPFETSKWWIEHTSDILRSLTLFKFGGIYLDTDMLVVKSLTPLGPNWVAKEDNTLVNSAAIAISTDQIGRRLANALIKELKTTYTPDIWIHNGPGAITRVLVKFCKTRHANKWTSSSCNGLEVYSPEYFYPIYYNRCKVYFEPGELNTVTKNAYAYHLWNKLTHNIKIEKGSPLMGMAKEFCPSIFQMYGDSFGDV
ncbi:unnamed protein product [Arctia plantaginis]|uniref:Alpha 1,4-glycosyltransferase domain-containing protein n=1 Tax=Arctia plantaginis TaxID=874455 RepID=A0A8S1AYY5_ARCPL|nr:unnamed protein product [Arctia plantaginis]